MLQLAMAQEFAGEEDEAKTWYGKIVREYPSQPQAKKAAGYFTEAPVAADDLAKTKGRGLTDY